MKPRLQIALGIALVLLGFLVGGRTLPDGLAFLFQIKKSYIGKADQFVSHDELWRMHNGLWGIVPIAFGAWHLAAGLWSLHKTRRSDLRTNEQDQSIGPSLSK